MQGIAKRAALPVGKTGNAALLIFHAESEMPSVKKEALQPAVCRISHKPLAAGGKAGCG